MDTLKIIVIGDYGVGKTALITRFVRPEAGAADTTNHFVKRTEIDGRSVTVQLWDSGGSGLPSDAYASADACVLVFDLNRQASLESLSSWYEECVRRVGNSREFPFVVLGNMIDKCGITVEATKNAVAWCVDHGNLPYYETSATEGYNVDRAFQFVLEKAFSVKSGRGAGGGGDAFGRSPAMRRPATPLGGASSLYGSSSALSVPQAPQPSFGGSGFGASQGTAAPPQQSWAPTQGSSTAMVAGGGGHSLAADCKRMLNNSRFADVKFIVQGQPIYGNRQFLAMRCEGFANMFESQKSTTEFIINEKDCTYDAFLTVLEYLYTSEIGNFPPNSIAQIFTVAKLYGVDALKVHCASQIQNCVSAENAAEMLVTMQEAGSQEMTQYCLDYIVTNREKVIVTKGFEELSRHPHLLMEVAKAFASGGS